MGSGGLFWFFVWLQAFSLALALVYLRDLKRQQESRRRVILRRLRGPGDGP